MKRLNNKGMTLTELLVSITMLSVAMVLMYSLMSDLRKRQKEVSYRTNDMIRVSDIEYKLQESIMKSSDYGRDAINSVKIEKSSSTITITIDSKVHKINVRGNTISYDLDSAPQAKWSFEDKNCEIDNVNTSGKSAVIAIKCAVKNNQNLYDYIKIPLYFAGLSGNITN